MRRAVERLVDGQREALEVLRRALDGEAPAEEALQELEDVLQGALDDARAILPSWGRKRRGTRRDRPRPRFLFAAVLTGRSAGDESRTGVDDNGKVQTHVCDTTKEGRRVGVAAWQGRGTDREIGRVEVAERELTAFVEKRLARRVKAENERAALLGDRGEGAR